MLVPTRQTDPTAPALPAPRGPISEQLVRRIRGELARTPSVPDAVWDDDDAQLALYLCYELHYRGFSEAVVGAEWDPWIISLRTAIEERFLAEVAATIEEDLPSTPEAVEDWLVAVASSGRGPSLSRFMEERGTRSQMAEFCVHRSAYQLKEADPHTWGIPRLQGEAKAAMVQIQSDEYGDGVAAEMHSALFATTMAELGLDPTYGAFVDQLPAATLATCNLASLFGLHHRWRGAIVGHLALFEMTSIGPMQKYANALRRLGLSTRAQRFYAVHVEADVVHERIAVERLVRGLLRDHPELAHDVAFGAEALSAVERRFTERLLAAWSAGQTSLRTDDAREMARSA